ncbi:SDR family NAD(P)-dependent oxidoreductase [Paraburkholderia domus]|uniref:5-keto-D-gluconate 5-reductase n=1 Tax=Paraburkholderia domus TaxID=2793075 RepID=A0A9N8NAA7_9BURK|nr:SDR family oxidoreductase [Paraburkholderia domus]MBK5053762.1 SDR family oxidoreductase [Burkholderia sp. R-70006]MBK5065588.1 SDR family oxidoreductase [Burkholderia sp. R-70199]MBK5122261.1 SDR family oxidoreductase [Burkholderia sp. R-69980]MBK5170064.1 SDR family oxidoreductase [Burkholderia sp. R-70211]MBK5185228.1 SDR family oxidoreductase [Burkholderia sp. R-69749]
MTQSNSPAASEWLGLYDRVCVVTGAGSGIGAETARELARVGASIAVLDRDDAAAAKVASEIQRDGGRAIGVCTDIGEPDSVFAAAKRVEQELGPCRVLVNNAAIRHRQPLMELPLDVWNRVLAVNLTGALVCTKAFAAQMIAAGQGGSLIHVASLVAHFPQGGSGPYCASKAAMITLSRTLTLELAPHRIRSNVVSPGQIRTPASEAVYRDPVLAAARERAVPSGRVGAPADLANVIAFLASDRSEYINAQEILVDGGISSTLMEANKRPLNMH